MGNQTQPKTDEASATDDENDVEGHRQHLIPGLPGTGGDSLLPRLPGTGGERQVRRPAGGGELTGEGDAGGNGTS